MITLSKGDIVDIIAPSSICTKEDFDKACEYISSIGLIPKTYDIGNSIPPHLDSYDPYRISQLNSAFESNSKAIWCLRGGYGLTRVINKINKAKTKKLIIGFSDITTLFLYSDKFWDMDLVHGPMLNQITNKLVSESSIKSTEDLIFRRVNNISYQLENINDNNTEVNAKIIGGNLSLIQASIGQKWQIDTKNKILFIEEVNEASYRIDRILTHIAEHIKCSAILFGDLINEDDNEPILKEFAKKLDIPVKKIKIGHGKNNPALPLNIAANLTDKLNINL